MTCALHLGPAAAVLRTLPRASVDMVYADPPFGNRKDWTGKAGSFSDKWSDSERSTAGWARLRRHSPAGADLMAACCSTATHRGYLGTMADILLGCRRVLRFDGSMWLHFDDTMGAHLRVLLDVVFGCRHALGTIIWKRTAGGHSTTTRSLGRIHDTIAVYGRIPEPLILGVNLANRAQERVDYPTQKPVALLRMFVEAATELGRRAIGIDQSPDAIATTRRRLDASASVPAARARRRAARPTVEPASAGAAP